MAFAGTAVGLLLYSGFIGIAVTIFAAWVLTYAVFGMAGTRRMAPVLSLLFLAIPLPLNLDLELIFKMQFLASNLASWLLDGASVMHVRQGVILVTEQAQYMTEEACSGVRSLFSSLAVVACYSVAWHHHGLRVLANLVQTVFWVVVGNAIRVALTVVLADNVSLWFAVGAGHELLSLIVFAFILGMVASTDRILGAFFRTWFNVDWDLEDYVDENHFDGLYSARSAKNLTEQHATSDKQRLRFGRPSLLLWLFIALPLCLVLLVALRVARVQWFQTTESPIAQLTSVPRLPALVESDLPVQVAGWKRVSYEHVTRERSSLFASDSFTWEFQREALQAVVSIDCPWDQWHNLSVCYTAIGWDCRMQTMLEQDEAPNRQRTHSEIMLSKPSGNHGFVIFSAVDANRKDALPDWRHRGRFAGEWTSVMTRQAKSSLGLESHTEDPQARTQLPVTTIQVLSEQSNEYSEADLEAVRELFFEARDWLLQGRRWAG